MSVLRKMFHQLPDGMKRWIRLYTYSYNDIIGGQRSTFKSRIDRCIDVFVPEEKQCDKEYISLLKKDIKKSWLKYGASPDEYFLFGFMNLGLEARKRFITDYEKDSLLCSVMDTEVVNKELRDKYGFYVLTAPYFHRKVLRVNNDSNEQDFIRFALDVKDLFIKPNFLSRGRGVFSESIESEEKARAVYKRLMDGGEWIVEERIKQCKEMSQWNSSSVNTIRIPTFLNRDGFFVGVPFFRTGRTGSCVDNAGSGGIFANVDASTGVLYTNGVDEYGHFYEKHPDSGLKYKGFRIPRWNELLVIVEEIHMKCLPHHLYVGWDFALTDDGWALIEGNWGQFVSQYADHVGFRDCFRKYVLSGKFEG